MLYGKKQINAAICHDHLQYQIKVTTEIGSGIGVHVQGIPDERVREVLLRVLASLQSIGYAVPADKIKITIEYFRDEWDSSQLDLPIAVSIYALQNNILLDTDDVFLCGELALNGDLRDLSDGMRLSDFAARLGKKVFLPKVQYLRKKSYCSNLPLHQDNVIPVDNLRDVINHLDQF